jgi:hypothetical protein
MSDSLGPEKVIERQKRRKHYQQRWTRFIKSVVRASKRLNDPIKSRVAPSDAQPAAVVAEQQEDEDFAPIEMLVVCVSRGGPKKQRVFATSMWDSFLLNEDLLDRIDEIYKSRPKVKLPRKPRKKREENK